MIKIKPPSRWWKVKGKIKRLFMSKKRVEAEKIAAANSFWDCFTDEEKQRQMKYFNDLIKQSGYRRAQTNNQPPE